MKVGRLAERKVDAAHSPPLGHLVVMRFRLLVTGHHGLRCHLLVMFLWELTKPVVFSSYCREGFYWAGNRSPVRPGWIVDD